MHHISSLSYLIVIKKGGGIRPYEALATLYIYKEGATFYHMFFHGIDNTEFFYLTPTHFFDNFYLANPNGLVFLLFNS